jgi:hypothetical protein
VEGEAVEEDAGSLQVDGGRTGGLILHVWINKRNLIPIRKTLSQWKRKRLLKKRRQTRKMSERPQ